MKQNHDKVIQIFADVTNLYIYSQNLEQKKRIKNIFFCLIDIFYKENNCDNKQQFGGQNV